MKIIRNFVSNKIFIHVIFILGLAALWGSILMENKYLLLFVALSFMGAICGSFIRVIDEIKNKT
jgi:hypothetical protein